MSKISSQENK